MNMIVKELCKEKGISMKDLANKLGITYQSLFDSLNGNPTLKRLTDIADVLGVSVPELFGNPQSNTPTIICPHCGKQITIKAE